MADAARWQTLATGFGRVIAAFARSSVSPPAAYTHSTRQVKHYAMVNTSKFAYSVGICPAGTTTFSAATVTYTTNG